MFVVCKGELLDECLETGYCAPLDQRVDVALAFVRLCDEEIRDVTADVVLPHVSADALPISETRT